MMISKPCLRCKKDYISQASAKRKYCSRACAFKRIPKVCQQCGKTFMVKPSIEKFHSPKYCEYKCYSDSRRGKQLREKHWNWKGGRNIVGGYVLLSTPHHPLARGCQVPEHWLVAEKALGRFLDGKEVIHHINEIKDDNRVENLYLFPNTGAHTAYHLKVDKGLIPRIVKSNLV